MRSPHTKLRHRLARATVVVGVCVTAAIDLVLIAFPDLPDRLGERYTNATKQEDLELNFFQYSKSISMHEGYDNDLVRAEYEITRIGVREVFIRKGIAWVRAGIMDSTVGGDGVVTHRVFVIPVNSPNNHRVIAGQGPDRFLTVIVRDGKVIGFSP